MSGQSLKRCVPSFILNYWYSCTESTHATLETTAVQPSDVQTSSERVSYEFQSASDLVCCEEHKKMQFGSVLFIFFHSVCIELLHIRCLCCQFRDGSWSLGLPMHFSFCWSATVGARVYVRRIVYTARVKVLASCLKGLGSRILFRLNICKVLKECLVENLKL